MKGGRGRRILLRTLLVLVSTVVGIKAADIAVGILDPMGISHFRHKHAFDTTALRDRHVEQSFSLAELVPGTDLQAGVRYRVNTVGFRGRETTREKPKDTWRMVVLGDSVTFGWGVEEEDRFTEVVERRLNETKGDGPTIEICNLAVPGYETIHQMQVLKSLGMTLQPDAVVIVFNQNDVQIVPDEVMVVHELSQERLERVGWIRRFLLEEPWRDIMHALLPNLRHLGVYHYIFATSPSDEQQLTNTFAGMADGIRIALMLFAETQQKLAKQGVKMAVLDLQQFEEIRNGCREAGVPYQSIIYDNYLTDMSLRNSAADPHPNAAGHRLLADGFERAIRELGILPGAEDDN